MFKLDYKFDLEVTAIDTDIINVFMTYIQLYFFEIVSYSLAKYQICHSLFLTDDEKG